ncbi:MAG: transmembrane 220 family protein [Pseudomonadota bacterium]
MPASLPYRLFSATLAVVFALSTAVQFNDPDAWRWIALYGASACAAGLALASRLSRWIPWIIFAVAAAWLIAIAGPAWRALPETGASLLEMRMQDLNVELVREAGGLAIVLVSMLALALWRPAPAIAR